MTTGKTTLLYKCPKCKKKSKTYQELDEKFGFRNMNRDSTRNYD